MFQNESFADAQKLQMGLVLNWKCSSEKVVKPAQVSSHYVKWFWSYTSEGGRVKSNGLNKLAWIFKMFLFDKINSFPKAINFVKSNTNSSNISVFISTKTFLTIIRLFKRLKVRNLFQKLWKISESLRVKRKWWSLNEQLKLSPFRSW